MRFEADLEYSLLLLCKDLNDGTYMHGSYSHRIVNEKKRRDISVAGVRDRVVHRLLYDYLVPVVNTKLDPDVWSCRPSKGLHKALQRAALFSKRYSGGYFWRADVAKFFDHVNHETLKACLRRHIAEEKAQNLLDKVIDSYTHNEKSVSQSRHGIPIGNLTSQIFANIYLNEFDRYVRHTIKPLAYMRYGDDVLLFFSTKHKAQIAQKTCTAWLNAELSLAVHPKNDIVRKVTSGIHFLGHHIYANGHINVDSHMQRKIEQKLSVTNIATYKAMHITAKKRKKLDWSLHQSNSFKS